MKEAQEMKFRVFWDVAPCSHIEVEILQAQEIKLGSNSNPSFLFTAVQKLTDNSLHVGVPGRNGNCNWTSATGGNGTCEYSKINYFFYTGIQ
jgi:hypothetical protein